MFYSDKFSKNQEGIKKTPQLNRPIFGGRLKLRSFLLYQSANDSVTVNLYRIAYCVLAFYFQISGGLLNIARLGASDFNSLNFCCN